MVDLMRDTGGMIEHINTAKLNAQVVAEPTPETPAPSAPAKASSTTKAVSKSKKKK
jgi:hypothetical protein